MTESNRSHLAVNISAGPVVDGMGNEDTAGSYIRINFDGRRYKISKGMAEGLLAELSAVLDRRPSAGAEPEVVEAARRVDIAIKSISGKRIPIKFPNDEIAMTFTTIIENAGKVARALLSVPRSVKDLGVNS